jgi:hypothetical protein
MLFSTLFSVLFYLVPIFFPIILCCLFFKKGKLIWVPPIISLSIELIATIFFIFYNGDIKSAFNGEAAIFTVFFLPICSAWSLLCSLTTVLIRFLFKIKKNMEIKFETSKKWKAIILVTSIFLLLDVSYLLFATSVPSLIKLLILSLVLTVCSLLISLLFSNITIYNKYMIIHGGIFFHKKLKFSDISNIYEEEDNENIKKGYPIYSKNIVAIEYKNKKTYFSIKEQDKEKIFGLVKCSLDSKMNKV